MSQLLSAGRLVAIASRAGWGIVAMILSKLETCRNISATDDPRFLARFVTSRSRVINAFIYAALISMTCSVFSRDKKFSILYSQKNFHIRLLTIDNTHDPFKPKNGSAITARIMSGGNDNRDVEEGGTSDSKESRPVMGTAGESY